MASHVSPCMQVGRSIKGGGDQFVEEGRSRKERKRKRKGSERKERKRERMRRKGERKREKMKLAFRRLELVIPTIGTRLTKK